jgi:hypothetical protein
MSTMTTDHKSKLRRATDSDAEHHCRSGERSREKGDSNRNVSACRKEVNLNRTRVFNNEVNERDTKYNDDYDSRPCTT